MRKPYIPPISAGPSRQRRRARISRKAEREIKINPSAGSLSRPRNNYCASSPKQRARDLNSAVVARYHRRRYCSRHCRSRGLRGPRGRTTLRGIPLDESKKFPITTALCRNRASGQTFLRLWCRPYYVPLCTYPRAFRLMCTIITRELISNWESIIIFRREIRRKVDALWWYSLVFRLSR